jgi:hypothetical protein
MYKITHHWDDKQKPGWYEYTIHKETWIQNIPKYIDYYFSIVAWINDNIEMSHRHSRWTEDHGSITVRFRYERDYLRFILRWS